MLAALQLLNLICNKFLIRYISYISTKFLIDKVHAFPFAFRFIYVIIRFSFKPLTRFEKLLPIYFVELKVYIIITNLASLPRIFATLPSTSSINILILSNIWNSSRATTRRRSITRGRNINTLIQYASSNTFRSIPAFELITLGMSRD